MPLHLEHRLTANAVAALGAGAYVAPDDDSQDIAEELSRALTGGSLHQAAREFAQRYEGFDRDHQAHGIVRRMLDLCG